MRKIVSILLSVLLVIPMFVTAYADDGDAFYPDAPILELDVETEVHYDGTEASGMFRFTPEQDGIYEFRSSGSYDTYGVLYSDTGVQLATNDDGGGGYQFLISRTLEAGTTYVLLARRLSASETADFTVTVTRIPAITDIELSLTDPDATLYVGKDGSFSSGYYYFPESTVFDIITITATFDDGSVAEIPYNYKNVNYSYTCSSWVQHGGANTLTVSSGGVSASINVPLATIGEYLSGVRDLVPGVPADVTYDGSVVSGALRFVPVRDGEYEIFSEGSTDTFVEFIGSDGVRITSNDDGGSDSNFLVRTMLTAGEAYYVLSRTYSGGNGSYSVTARRMPDVTRLTLSLAEREDRLIMGKDGSMSEWYDDVNKEWVPFYSFSDSTLFNYLVINAEFEDGTAREIPYDYSGLEISFDCRNCAPGGENLVTVSRNGASASISFPVEPYAAAFPDAPEMELDVPLPVECRDGNEQCAVFTPAEGGVYYFYSEGDDDPMGYLYDGTSLMIAKGDDAGTSLNFAFAAELEAGIPCVLITDTYSGADGDFSVVVSREAPEFAAGYDALEGLDLSGKMINIVFVVDTTGSMGWVINNVRNTLSDFVTALVGTNARLRISLIDYKDIIEDLGGPATTVIHYSPREAIWYENAEIDDILSEISTLRAVGGGDRPESVVDALGYVVEPETMTFNSDAAKFVFLLTDADYREENTHDIENMEDLIGRLSEIGVATSVITTRDFYETYKDLVSGTGGVLINLGGDFAAGMGSFAAAVASSAADYVPEEGVIPVSGISFGEDLEIPVGKIRSFTATVSPADATDKRIVWSVEDEAIARVSQLTTDSLLVLRGISTGSTRVIARSMDGGYAAYFDLTVSGIVEDGRTIEGCDIHALITRADELKSKGLSADLIYYSEAGDEPLKDEEKTDAFGAVCGTPFSVSFVFDDELGEMMYVWRFAGGEIVKTDIPVEMEIRVADPASPAKGPAETAFPGRPFTTVDFLHAGELPGAAGIKVAVDLPDGKYDLYYYNELTGEFERAGKATVEGGVASFTISHCSSYVLVGSEAKPKPEFVDVPSNAYYAPAVDWAVENEITTGTSAKTFSPEDGCTRGHVVTFLWRTVGCPKSEGTKNPFVDVKPDDYFYEAVLWAVEKGITKGTDTTHFSPDDTCTRGQIVTFLYRFSGNPSVGSVSNPFRDVGAKDYFYDPVLWAVGKGVTKGTDASHFSPDDTCTRGQVVTFLYRAKTGS